MEITTKLMGMLKSQSPPDNRLVLDDGASVATALDRLQVPADHVHLIMVNSQIERDLQRVLKPDDELMVMPPVGGG